MSAFSIQRPECSLFSKVFSWVCMLVLSLGVAAEAEGQSRELPCEAAIEIGASDRWRGLAERRALFNVEIPEAGVASLTVSSPLSLGEWVLMPASQICGRSVGGPAPTILDSTMSHLVLAANRPGIYSFEVAWLGGVEPPGEVELETAFVAGRRGWSTSQESEVEENEDEIEVEPDPRMPNNPMTRHALLAELCRSVSQDDHGDSFTCATVLGAGAVVTGVVSGGDEDLFEIVIGDPWNPGVRMISIEAVAEFGISGQLFDAAGRRLMGGVQVSDGFRIAWRLRAGTYFVKVSGTGGDGGYALIWDSRP